MDLLGWLLLASLVAWLLIVLQCYGRYRAGSVRRREFFGWSVSGVIWTFYAAASLSTRLDFSKPSVFADVMDLFTLLAYLAVPLLWYRYRREGSGSAGTTEKAVVGVVALGLVGLGAAKTIRMLGVAVPTEAFDVMWVVLLLGPLLALLVVGSVSYLYVELTR